MNLKLATGPNREAPVQHLSDITIPVIEITEGWAAESVKTWEEADDAFAYLMSACAQIEYQIDMECTKPQAHQDVIWLAKAKCALKYKKAALQIVNQRRSQINMERRAQLQNARDAKLLEYIRSVTPNDVFVGWIRESRCNEIADDDDQ